MPHQPDDDDHTWDQFEYHMNALGDITAQWRNGQISASVKRQNIADENRRYYGGDRKSPVTGERLTAQPRSESAAAVLADAAGIPVTAMNSALRARRNASVEAQRITDEGGSRDAALVVLADGVQAFMDICGTAAPPSGSWRPA
jgi:hypothetical protein